MKAKNIITGIMMAIGGLTSCTSEDLIEPRVDSGDVSVIFSVKDIQTKAETETGANENYTYATTDEITINNCIIAAFNGDITASGADNLVCIKYYEGSIASGDMVAVPETTSAKKKVPSYKCTLSDMKPGGIASKVSFLVIANSQHRNATVGKGSTYSDFKNLVETTTDFDARKLVKVGYKVVENLSATNNVVKVPLIQLTARIDFGGVKLDGNYKKPEPVETLEFYPVTDPADRNKFSEDVNKLLKIEEGTWNPDWKDVDTPDGYYYYKSHKTYYRVKFYKQTKVETTGKDLVVGDNKRIGGVNTTSALPIFSTEVIENLKYVAKDTFDITGTTFYTYENGSEGNVSLTVNCSVGTDITYVKYVYEKQAWTWAWSRNEYIWRSVSGGDVSEYAEEGTPVAKDKDYVITLPGSKIIKGHLYRVIGKCTPSSDVMLALEWKVIDLETGGEINIEFD